MRIRWRDMELPNRLIVENEDDFYGKYIIEPFERGFGTTIGNSLRRVLLSTIEGTAITSVTFKANGAPVLHEYSSVPGILEDFTEDKLEEERLLNEFDEIDKEEETEPFKSVLAEPEAADDSEFDWENL